MPTTTDTTKGHRCPDITHQLALRAVAQTGLTFHPHAYVQERHKARLELAGQMTATLNGSAALDPQLAAEFEAYWRSQIQVGVLRYITPKVGVGAVVTNDQDELLLICRRDSGRWLYPTGRLDVGQRGAQGNWPVGKCRESAPIQSRQAIASRPLILELELVPSAGDPLSSMYVEQFLVALRFENHDKLAELPSERK
jgi:hypothetical protein